MIINSMVKKSTKNLSISSDFQVINSFQHDPFVGHLSTPITSSNIVNSYLLTLAIYQKKSSLFLAGINIGLVHGFFLMGPFVLFGPLRNTEYNIFFAFLSVISLVSILALAILIYKTVIFQNKSLIIQNKSLTESDWNKVLSGFCIGGLFGPLISTILIFYSN
jgi:photosystem I subunit 11